VKTKKITLACTISVIFFQGYLDGTQPSKYQVRKHLHGILNNILKHTENTLVDIRKYTHQSKKYLKPKELEVIKDTLRKKRIKVIQAKEYNDIKKLKNIVQKERCLIALDQKEFDLPEDITLSHAPDAIIFENTFVQEDKLIQENAQFFTFNTCLTGANDKSKYIDAQYARAAEFISDTLTYMDIDNGDTPRHAYQKLHSFIQMPGNMKAFLKKYALDQELHKFYLGKIYKKYDKDTIRKIQNDAIAGKALAYQVNILLKPQYIRPFAHDLLALIKSNKFLKNYIDYVKINTNVTIAKLTQKDIAPSIVICPCLLPQDQRDTILKKIIKTVHHKFRNYARDITYNFAPTLSVKVKDFISLSGGNYFEKNSYKHVVASGKSQNTVYTQDYAFFKNNTVDIDGIRETLC